MTENAKSGRPSRRGLIVGGAFVAVAAIAALFYFEPFETKETPLASASAGGGELMQNQPLPDMVMGSPDAPVTIVEYASMTCGACANFHKLVYPELKSKYIDTGKAKLILREFPLDRLAAAAFMLARCGGEQRFYPIVDALFETQKSWAFGEGDATPRLMQFARQAGFSEEEFNKCVGDEEQLKRVAAVRELGNTKFGVESTPTFFVNGKKLDAPPGVDLKLLETEMAPYLDKAG